MKDEGEKWWKIRLRTNTIPSLFISSPFTFTFHTFSRDTFFKLPISRGSIVTSDLRPSFIFLINKNRKGWRAKWRCEWRVKERWRIMKDAGWGRHKVKAVKKKGRMMNGWRMNGDEGCWMRKSTYTHIMQLNQFSYFCWQGYQFFRKLKAKNE